MEPRKRKSLTMGQKAYVIQAIEGGGRKTDVARWFGLSTSTVSAIWKSKEMVLQAAAEGSAKRKKMRGPQHEDLDQAMHIWFKQQRANAVPINGPIVRMKAEKFAEELGITNFKASEGWLGKFKQRHGINLKDIDSNLTSDWLMSVWPKLKTNYSENDIFNADETGFFFKITPDKSVKFKNVKCVSGKLAEQRLTVFVAANMSGTEKRKLLVIGKSLSPRCFHDIEQLPVTYRFEKSSWMTSQLFEEELRSWDAELKERKILLLVDNCPAHPVVENLKNIELAFFPANSSILQPMHQGIIKSLKSCYRKKMLMDLIQSNGKGTIDLLDAVLYLNEAWEEVTVDILQHSFRRTGLCTTKPNERSQLDKDPPWSEWLKQFRTSVTFSEEELQCYPDVDAYLVTTANLTDTEILREVKGEEETEMVDVKEEPEENELPSVSEALNAVKLLKKYFIDDKDSAAVVSKLHTKILKEYWRQRNVKGTTL